MNPLERLSRIVVDRACAYMDAFVLEHHEGEAHVRLTFAIEREFEGEVTLADDIDAALIDVGVCASWARDGGAMTCELFGSSADEMIGRAAPALAAAGAEDLQVEVVSLGRWA